MHFGGSLILSNQEVKGARQENISGFVGHIQFYHLFFFLAYFLAFLLKCKNHSLLAGHIKTDQRPRSLTIPAR